MTVIYETVDHQMVLHAVGNNKAGEAAGAAGRGVSNQGSRAVRETIAEVTAFALRSQHLSESLRKVAL